MQSIKRGDIYHRHFTTTNPPKGKFFVVVGEDSNNYVGYFFVNSNINNFVARNSKMMEMQMSIKPTDYPFLTHLSFVAGHQLSVLPKMELLKEIQCGKAQYKGRMNEEDMDMLLRAALQSPLFSDKEKNYFR